MSRFGITATLAGLVILSGCAGVGRMTGTPTVSEGWAPPGPAVTSSKDPFVPRPQPGLGAGMARYFPGLSRLTVNPKAVERSEPVPEVTLDRPRLGFRLDRSAPVPEATPERPRLGFGLFRKWIRRDPASVEPSGPDQLARRGDPRRPSVSEDARADASETLPPRLPVALLAEVDPAILPATGSALASRSEERGGLPQRLDDAARRVRARLDEVVESPAFRPDPHGLEASSNPFEGFDLADSPVDLSTEGGQEVATTDPGRAGKFDEPVVAGAIRSASKPADPFEDFEKTDAGGPIDTTRSSRPTDPFDGFDALLGPNATESRARVGSPRGSSRTPRLASDPPRQRYGHLTLPISRRYDPAPLTTMEESEPEPVGRPRLPPTRPRRERAPKTSAMLPPVTFPAAYYDDEARRRPAIESPEEPRGRQRRFNWLHLFDRGESEPEPRGDLAGVEANHVPEPR